MMPLEDRPVEGSQSILVVDDSPDNLTAFSALLEPLGHDIVTAASGEDALQLLARRQFALLLLDVRMPGLDGFATVVHLREQIRRVTPVVFITGLAGDDAAMHRAYEFGAVDYLVKPIDPDVLRGKVRNLLMLYKQSLELERRAALIIAQQHQFGEAAHIGRSRDATIEVLAHGLRQTLQAVVRGVDLILNRSRTTEPNDVTSERLRRTSSRATELLDQLRHLVAPVGRGTVSIRRRESTDLDEICDAIVEETRLAYPDNAVIRIGKAGSGWWDGALLAQVLSNLLTNAAQHGKKDEPITLRLQDEGGAAILEVHNCGVAIAEDVLTGLCEPDVRDSRAVRGRGLRIAREIIVAHVGTVDVRSTAVDGTTFRIFLPRRALDSLSRPSEGPEQRGFVRDSR